MKRRVREIAVHALEGEDVAVTTTWNGQPISTSTFIIGLTEGPADTETVGRQPLTVDRFTIDCDVRLFGFLDGDQAELEVERILDLFDTALRSSHRLTDVDGLTDGDTASYAGVSSVRIRSVDGPGHTIPTPGNTIQGWVSFELDCTVDMT